MKSLIEKIKNPVESSTNRSQRMNFKVGRCYMQKCSIKMWKNSWVKLRKLIQQNYVALFNTIKRPKVRVVGISEGEEKDMVLKDVFTEIINVNICNR